MSQRSDAMEMVMKNLSDLDGISSTLLDVYKQKAGLNKERADVCAHCSSKLEQHAGKARRKK